MYVHIHTPIRYVCGGQRTTESAESALPFHVSMGSGHQTQVPRLARQVHLPDEPSHWPSLLVLVHEILLEHSQACSLMKCPFYFRAVVGELSRDHKAGKP